MSATATVNQSFAIGGPNIAVEVSIAADTSYPTGGYSIAPALVGLSNIYGLITFGTEFGYQLNYNTATSKLLFYDTAAAGLSGTVTPLGSNGTSAVTGTGTFTGTAPLGSLNVASPAFSGTGQASAGQVITTTDNQTMTLNQAAGMWFVSATHGPYLIASNTAVAGAPAVLTIVGTAPTTDAGAYQILKALTPIGTVSALSGTAAAQTFTGASSAVTISGTGSFGEVPNGTNLSAVTAYKVLFIGN